MSIRKFHTFDFLRFVAFFLVFLCHVPLDAFPFLQFLKHGGGIGVSFFFVLSGFLISYIILNEKKESGHLNLKRFMLRRVLRIWPLFYAMLLLAYLTPHIAALLNVSISNQGYEPNWLMSILFLENIKMIQMDAFPNVSPLPVMWTLCIEEHFYLVWASVLYFIPIKRFGWLFIISICVANISRILFYMQGWPFIDLLTNIDYFAFGAIPAFLYIQYGMRLEKIILQIPFWQILFLITLVIVYVISSMQFTFPGKELIDPTLLGLLCSGLVFLIIPQHSVIKISDRNIFSMLGTYTYGLYLTHTIVINLLIQIYKKMDLPLHIISNGISFFLISLIAVLLVGIIVFYVIERPFLHLKKKVIHN